MPGFTSHIIHGEQAVSLFSAKYRALIDSGRAAFNLGLQGADVLMCGQMFKGSPKFGANGKFFGKEAAVLTLQLGKPAHCSGRE